MGLFSRRNPEFDWDGVALSLNESPFGKFEASTLQLTCVLDPQHGTHTGIVAKNANGDSCYFLTCGFVENYSGQNSRVWWEKANGELGDSEGWRLHYFEFKPADLVVAALRDKLRNSISHRPDGD